MLSHIPHTPIVKRSEGFWSDGDDFSRLLRSSPSQKRIVFRHLVRLRHTERLMFILFYLIQVDWQCKCLRRHCCWPHRRSDLRQGLLVSTATALADLEFTQWARIR